MAFFFFKPFNKLENKLHSSQGTKNTDKGAVGAKRAASQEEDRSGAGGQASPRLGSVANGLGLLSQLLGFLPEYSRILEGWRVNPGC